MTVVAALKFISLLISILHLFKRVHYLDWRRFRSLFQSLLFYSLRNLSLSVLYFFCVFPLLANRLCNFKTRLVWEMDGFYYVCFGWTGVTCGPISGFYYYFFLISGLLSEDEPLQTHRPVFFKFKLYTCHFFR